MRWLGALRRRRQRQCWRRTHLPLFGRGAWSKVISAILGILAALAVLELGLRIHAAWKPSDPERDLQRAWNVEPKPYLGSCGGPERDVGLAEIVRPSPSPDVVYELKPNLDTCFEGARVQTNPDGLRAPKQFARPKPLGTFRVVLVGDSQTFGHGVAYEHTWGAVIERELARHTQLAVEVVNTGVNGYNTAMEAAHFAQYGISYEPDCVVILFMGNDLGLPHLMLKAPDVLSLKKSFLVTTLRRALGTQEPERWFEIAAPPYGRYVPDEDIERVPERYRHMVGWTGYRRALERIASVAGARHKTVVNFADYRTRTSDASEIIAFQRRLGILHPTFEYPAGPKYALANDPHLSIEGNAELARRIITGLRETGRCLPPR